MNQIDWNALGTSVVADPEAPTGDFAFLADPISLLSTDQQRDLREDLADLTRLRREAESEGATPRLS